MFKFEMIWEINEVLLKEGLKWFTNDGENICKRKEDFKR